MTHQFIVTIRKDTVGCVVGVSFKRGQTVDADEVENEESLASSWYHADSNRSHAVLLAPSWRVDKIAVHLASEGCWEGKEAEEGEADRNHDTGHESQDAMDDQFCLYYESRFAHEYMDSFLATALYPLTPFI